MLSDTMTNELREIARQLIGSKTDDEEHEAVRAFLAVCATYGVYVDNDGQSLVLPSWCSGRKAS